MMTNLVLEDVVCRQQLSNTLISKLVCSVIILQSCINIESRQLLHCHRTVAFHCHRSVDFLDSLRCFLCSLRHFLARLTPRR